MKKKICPKNQGGFIQISLLATIIVSTLLVSVITTGAFLYKEGKLSPLLASMLNVLANSDKEKLDLNDAQEIKQENNEIQTEYIKKLAEGIVPGSNSDSVSIQAPIKSTTKNETTTQEETLIKSWPELEKEYFLKADQEEWAYLIITNAVGEKRYYRKENEQWVRKSSEAEIKEPYVSLPTAEQLEKIRKVCLYDESAPICGKEDFMSGYISNPTFRKLIDPLIDEALALLEVKRSQQFAAEKKISDCIMAPTPEDERELSPATQNYLRQLRCGTVSNADRTNYELHEIRSSLDELKYRLKTNISFSPVLFDTLEPAGWENQWEIRWDGYGGGTIKDSSGSFYRFRCENNYCKSY